MFVLDLRYPRHQVGSVVVTEENPLAALRKLSDRSKAVLMVYADDYQYLRYCCVSFNPATQHHGFAEAGTADGAYEMAQPQYQRETGLVPGLE